MTKSPSPLNYILELNDVCVQYGDSCVLRVPSLRLAPGQILLLTGPNGSGKSSLLLGLAGTGPNLTGQVRYLSQNLAALSPPSRPRHGLRLLPQGRRIFPRLTPSEHVHLARRTLGPTSSTSPDQRLQPLDPRVSNRSSSGVSGGEAKAILLTSLIVPGLRLLMLDEPFAGLDARATAHLVVLIQKTRSSGTAMILVDHTNTGATELDEVELACIQSDGKGHVLVCQRIMHGGPING